MLFQLPPPDEQHVLRIANQRFRAQIAGCRAAASLLRQVITQADEAGNVGLAKWARDRRHEAYRSKAWLQSQPGFDQVFEREWNFEQLRMMEAHMREDLPGGPLGLVLDDGA